MCIHRTVTRGILVLAALLGVATLALAQSRGGFIWLYPSGKPFPGQPTNEQIRSGQVKCTSNGRVPETWYRMEAAIEIPSGVSDPTYAVSAEPSGPLVVHGVTVTFSAKDSVAGVVAGVHSIVPGYRWVGFLSNPLLWTQADSGAVVTFDQTYTFSGPQYTLDGYAWFADSSDSLTDGDVRDAYAYFNTTSSGGGDAGTVPLLAPWSLALLGVLLAGALVRLRLARA